MTPLALTAGELVRISVDIRLGLGDTDEAYELEGALARLSSRPPLVKHDGLADLPSDRVNGVQTRHRLLEDHRDGVPAYVAHIALGQAQQVASVELDRAGLDAARR